MHLVLCEHVEVLPNGRKCKKTPSHIPRGLLQKLSWIGDNFKIQLPDTTNWLPTDGPTDRPTNGRADRPMNGRTEEQTDIAYY